MVKYPWIDRNNPLPLHEQCKRLLLDQVQQGKFQPGEAIPSERELEQQYNLSRTTIRQAVAELVQQGLLQRRQGKGTFVTKSAIPYNLHHLTSFTEDMQAREKVPSSELLFAGLTEAGPKILEALATEAPVMKIERLRFADGKPMGLHTSYLPQQYKFDESRLKEEGSLYAVLIRDFHLEFVGADETLQATAANAEEASLLDVPLASPILRVERLSFNFCSEPKEFVIMRYRADKYIYYARLTR